MQRIKTKPLPEPEAIPKHPKYVRLTKDVDTLGGKFTAGTVMAVKQVYLVAEYGVLRGCCGVGVDSFEFVDAAPAPMPTSLPATSTAPALQNPLDGFDLDL